MNTTNKLIGSFLLLLVCTTNVLAQENESEWLNNLKNIYFPDQSIDESSDIIDLEAPIRAEDPALVPLKITSKINQSEKTYIKKILILVDKNPFPFVGEFEFSPESGKADLALRIRVNTYSYVRAIAQTNDGHLYMSKKFVKASGGCSVPISTDADASINRLGKMKFRLDQELKSGEPALVQLLISHPNITGMQMDQVTRFIKKSNFIEKINVSFDNKVVLKAKVDIAISSDPHFRFYFVPQKPGQLKAEFTDTSCESPISRDLCTQGKTYTETYQVSP